MSATDPAHHLRTPDERIPPRYPVDEPPTYRAHCDCAWTGPERYPAALTGGVWLTTGDYACHAAALRGKA